MSDTSHISQRAFKQAMRCLAATPTVVTTSLGGRRYGMTATAVNAVSAEPPSLLVCVNHSASIFQPLIQTRRFCVNVLESDQQHLCRIFSGGEFGTDRFRFGTWERGHYDIPFLKDAQANVFCQVEQQSSYSTHEILVARIEEIIVSEDTSPLIYWNGEFLRKALQVPPVFF